MGNGAGIRWKIADLTAISLAMILPSIASYLYFVRFSGQPSMRLVYGITKSIQFAFPAVWVFVVMRERLTVVRLRTLGVVEGVVFGLVASAVIAVAFALLKNTTYFAGMQPVLREKVRGLHANTPVTFIALGAFISVIHSFLEEYYFRWFMYGRLRRYIAFGPALILAALGFVAHHVIVLHAYFANWWFVALLSASVGIGGIAWSWLYERTRSLYAPWLSHFIVDAALMSVGYYLLFVSR